MASLTVLLLVSLVQGQTQTKPPIDPLLLRVFVHTSADGHADEVAAREASRKDLSAALASKKRVLVIVDDEDAADVSVEIQGRSITVPRVVIGLAGRPGDPPSSGLVRHGTLTVQVKSGRTVLALRNKNRTNDNGGGWKSAAEDVADQIDKWMREQREAILKRRGEFPRALPAPRVDRSQSLR